MILNIREFRTSSVYKAKKAPGEESLFDVISYKISRPVI